MVSDKERATNTLLFALSQYPYGMTTRELVDFGGRQLGQEQVVQLLRDSGHVQESYAGIPATLWKLKSYVPGSEKDEDLKARIRAG